MDAMHKKKYRLGLGNNSILAYNLELYVYTSTKKILIKNGKDFDILRWERDNAAKRPTIAIFAW